MKIIITMLKGTGLFGVVALVLLIPTMIIGWVMNIVALCHMFNGSITALFVGRLAGIFVAPLGALLGLFF